MNKIMNKLFILKSWLFLFMLSAQALCQDYNGDNSYAPPSPNAMGLVDLANTSVNLFTGTANVTLPIYEVQSRSLSVPITLNYNAGGIKVQDVAGWVGLGWSLNAGGSITRIVRGLPDEDANGFCGVNNIGEKAYSSYTEEYVTKVNSREWDSEPDIFYFNFLGRNGRFILDEAGNALLQPYSNLKISPGICGSNSSWTITDETGRKFLFGVNSSSKEISRYKANSLIDFSYTSSWYLSEIRDPNDVDVISFFYQNTAPFSYKYYLQEETRKRYKTNGFGTSCSSGTPILKNKNLEITIQSPVYLSRISSMQADVYFNLSILNREDIVNSKALGQIVINDRSSSKIASFDFSYSYFFDNSCIGDLCKRLKLERIGKSGNGESIPIYEFKYNTSVNLPSRDSNSIDHWGYFNSNTHTSKIPTVTDADITFSCDVITTFEGANRESDSEKSIANILTKIQKHNGESTEFIYEAHQYNEGTSTDKIAGGARIKTLKKCDGLSCLTTNYDYSTPGTSTSSGRIAALPKYNFRSGFTYFTVMSVNPPSGFYTTEDHLVVYSNSLKEVFTIEGYHIGYSNVKVYTADVGYELNYFTNIETNSDMAPYQSSFASREIGEIGQISSDKFPFTPNSSKLEERGLLIKREIFDQNSKLLHREINQFSFAVNELKKEVPAVKVGKRGSDAVYNYFHVGKYYCISKPVLLNSSIETIYDQSDPGNESKKITTTTEYSYVPISRSSPFAGSTVARDLLPRKVTTISYHE
jgi:hypothetical protein